VLLAIDTSTDTASLALAQDKTVLAELTWRSKQNHTTQLLPNLNQLFTLTGATAKSLTGVIIAQGPGSFNGLRVGVSAAKGLAFSLEIPIVGINSLEVAAYQYADCGLPVCAVFNAGRSEIATATYQKKRGKWQQTAAADIMTVEARCQQITGKTFFLRRIFTCSCRSDKSIAQIKRGIATADPGFQTCQFPAGIGQTAHGCGGRG
jgi:tRNA threonylcarbamoyl adenosine modification protein YeaZ